MLDRNNREQNRTASIWLMLCRYYSVCPVHLSFQTVCFIIQGVKTTDTDIAVMEEIVHSHSSQEETRAIQRNIMLILISNETVYGRKMWRKDFNDGESPSL